MRVSPKWLHMFKRRRRSHPKFQLPRNSKTLLADELQRAAYAAKESGIRWRWFRRGTREDFIHDGSFQEAIKPVLVLAQVISLMPVRGITAATPQQLRFTWLSFRTVYALVAISFFIVYFTLNAAFLYAFNDRMSFDEFDSLVFYGSILLIACLFLDLARKWPALSVEWARVERHLPPLLTEQQRSRLAYRIKMITLVTSLCSLVEHLLAILVGIYYANACGRFPGQPIESVLFSDSSKVFAFFPYSNALGVLGKVVNVFSTFAWNYINIFLMAVCVALSSRFRQLNDHMIDAVKQRHINEGFWIRCRIQYRSLCRLCDQTDTAISTITMLCFSNNLYYICTAILRSIRKLPTFTHTLYYWFSLDYLVIRTLFLSLYAADINEESKRPLHIFRGISHLNWCSELKRFSEEVHGEMVALSGMRYFYVTRGFLLSVAGTIVTYELVLMQFNKQDVVNDCYEGG